MKRMLMRMSRMAITMILIGAMCICVALGWYVSNLIVSKTYTLTVEVSEGLDITEVSCNNGTLNQVTGSLTEILGSDGKATTDYYEVTYKVTTPQRAKFYVKSITWPTAELGKALRVLVTFNGSTRLYAPDGATSGYTVGSSTVTFNTIGELIGVFSGTVDMTVRIFLEGQDAACTNANDTSNLNVGIEFEGVYF